MAPPINQPDRELRFRLAKGESMARKRYTAEEIIGPLRTIKVELGKGLGVVEDCRKLGITEQSCGMNCSTANSSMRCTRRG